MEHDLINLITERSEELNMLYAAYRFFKFPETKKEYLERPDEVATSCWLTARFCEDLFTEDPEGDWTIYSFHIEYIGYHDFTIAIHYDNIYLIDSYSDRYLPRIISVPEEDLDILMSPDWPTFYHTYFVSDEPDMEPLADYTVKIAKICPKVLDCLRHEL